MSTITEDLIRRIKPPCKPWLPCGDNLYLRCHVTKQGELSRRWFYRSEKAGFRSLGAAWPMMSIKAARAEVARIKTGDRNVKAIDLVRELAEDFYSTTIENRRKDADLVRGYLDREVLPTIGSMKVRDVTSEDAMRVVKPLVRRGKRSAANRCFDVVNLMFDYAQAHGKIKTNPCAPISKRKHVGGTEKPRQRNLTFGEITDMLARTDATAEAPIYRLLLLTGLRLNELLRVQRDMIDGDVLTMPGELMKAGREHKVFLSPGMVTLIEAQLARHKSPYLFPAETDAKSPFAKTTLQQRWMAVRPAGVTLHDLRRTMRTRCGELGIRPDVAELMIAHKLQGVQATYDHYSYEPELRAAWRSWSDKLDALA